MLKQNRVYLEDGIRYYDDEYKTIRIDYIDLERFKLQYKPFELVFYSLDIGSNFSDSNIYTKPVSHYRQIYGQRKGDSLLVQENEMCFCAIRGAFYFKTEEARTKFIMKWG